MNRINYRRLIIRPVRRLWYRFITLKSSNERIAAGFALGMLIGLLPTFGVQIILATALAMALRVNIFAALAGINITNYATVIPIYAFNYRVGCYVLGVAPKATFIVEQSASFLAKISHFAGAGAKAFGLLWLGSFIVAVPSTIISYFLMKWFLHYARSFISRRRLMRLEHLIQMQTGARERASELRQEQEVAAAPKPD